MRRSSPSKPRQAPQARVCADCGANYGSVGALPSGHRVERVRPETVVRCGVAPWNQTRPVSPAHGSYEARKAELVANARTADEYEAAIRRAAEEAGV